MRMCVSARGMPNSLSCCSPLLTATTGLACCYFLASYSANCDRAVRRCDHHQVAITINECCMKRTWRLKAMPNRHHHHVHSLCLTHSSQSRLNPTQRCCKLRASPLDNMMWHIERINHFFHGVARANILLAVVPNLSYYHGSHSSVGQGCWNK
jgi:hypothetical protein